MQKNKELHITFIGRLEKEKGIEILIACIKKSIVEDRNIVWHICGIGSYQSELEKLNTERWMNHLYQQPIHIYGYLDREKINSVLDKSDLVMMPSLFLETFGLVALETLSEWVPVVWFSQGGLTNFIHPVLALDVYAPVDSFFRILDNWVFPLMDISEFSHENWISKLTELTEWVDRILLVNDYLSMVWWAEQYIYSLARALRSIGKTVEVFGYAWKANRLIRIWLMFLSPFAFWRATLLDKKIQEFSPDLIWMQSILRYIGPHGVRSISKSKSKKYITHHDLGLITPRPSGIYSEVDIPCSPNLGDWIPKKLSLFGILAILPKWSMIRYIWSYLQKNTITHIFPSKWMQSFFQKYIDTIPIIFPHTTTIDDSVK